MADPSVKGVLCGSVGCCLLLLSPTTTLSYEGAPFEQEQVLVSTGELPSEAKAPEAAPVAQQETEGWREFFEERTQIGAGFDSAYDSNILLEDNNRQEDYINTLEGVLLFADPRGSLITACQWEVNAFRYMKKNKNAIDHDVVSFIDYDTGGRLQYHLTYYLTVNNSLSFGTAGVDILRTSSDFQRFVENKVEGRIRYALTEDNYLVSQSSYSVFDDQTQNDASSDRKIFKTTLDLDHSLTRTWTVFPGIFYEDRAVPGDKLKNSKSYGGRLGTRYELSLSETFTAVLEVERPQLKEQERDTDVNYNLLWKHAVGPRTDLTLGFTDARITSFSSGRTDFRSRVPSAVLSYQLLPLVTLTFSGLYEKQKSSSTGGGAAEIHKMYDLKFGVFWQIREQAKVTLDFSNRRSKTRDYTSRIVTLGYEATF
ncbi:MAG: hypothetical protein Q7J69_02935 [Candidatus Omnitrophota bacterium]|nr:hypothetical protein [Candidatus Omnitrophota bacterium]